MQTVKIWNDNPSRDQLDEICSVLREGGVVILPTDTIYGIACDALNPKGIDKVCRIKSLNPDKNVLSVICSDISMASEYARFDNSGFRLLRDNTPGPFTFIFKSASTLPKAFKGRKTVGVRIPDSNLCRQLAQRLGHPILTTSIQFDDDDHAVSPGLIAETYDGRADLFIEGEEGDTLPSTIVDCTGSEPSVTRQGKGELA